MRDLHITIKQKISLEYFEEIIVSALEGGSNYWYSLNVDEFEDKLLGEKGDPLTTRISKSLYEDPTFEMNVYDAEALEEDLLGVVTQKSMLKAIEFAHKDYFHIYHDLFEGQGDGNTADVLFQLAVMGEVIFG